MRLFSLDSPFMEGMRKLADVIIVNILFCFCCIPVITIGAAFAALTKSVEILADDTDDGLVFVDFFKAFARYFKKATLLEIILTLILAGFSVYQKAISLMDGVLARSYTITLYILIFLFIFFVQFLFPTLVEKEVGTFKSIGKAVVLSVVRFPYTLLSIIVVLAAFGLSYMIYIQAGYTVVIIWLLAGFGIVAYFNQIIYGWAVRKKRNDEVSDIR